MIANVGDRIVLEATDTEKHRRVGVVTAVCGDDGGPPYHVRWLDDGRVTLIFPGRGSRVERPTTLATA